MSSSNPNDFTKFGSQKSAAIELVAGRKYYIEILHQADDGTEHVEVAWQAPGGVREIIPAQQLASFVKELDDLDGDDLPDSWERQYGLDPSDNGATNILQASYSDFDNDGLTNREEYFLGTNPTVADTDGDGVDDYHERMLGSNPLLNDLRPFTEVQAVAGNAFIGTSGQWVSLGESGAVSTDRRGSVDYSFSVPSAQIWAFELNAMPVGTTAGLTVTMDLDIYVDGLWLGTFTMRSLNGAADKLMVLTHLDAGAAYPSEVAVQGRQANAFLENKPAPRQSAFPVTVDQLQTSLFDLEGQTVGSRLDSLSIFEFARDLRKNSGAFGLAGVDY